MQKVYNAELYQGRKEIIYLTTHSAHFIYGYMASDQTLSMKFVTEQPNIFFPTTMPLNS